MKKLLSSRAVFYTAQLFGFIFSYVLFLSYDMQVFALLVIIFCLAVIGGHKVKTAERKSLFARVDYTLLIVLAGHAFLAAVTFVSVSYNDDLSAAIAPGFLYVSGVVLLSETITRIKNRTLKETLYWHKFFKLYPVGRGIGGAMAVIFAGGVIVSLIFGDLIWSPVLGFLLSAVIFSFMTYFCQFILSMSALYEKANEDKIKAERFKAELITNVSHDIRAPLTSIINYVDLLKNLPIDNADFKEYTAVLDNKSARLKTLINDLMDASKAGTGNVETKTIDIDLCEIVGQISGEFEDKLKDGGLTLVSRHPEEAVTVRADGEHLRRVLENLFGNAAKYAMPKTRVFAEITADDGRTVFILRNTSAEPIDISGGELTEQFIRGDRARNTEGSGLGLYITKSLVEIMGGRLELSVTGDLFEARVVFSR